VIVAKDGRVVGFWSQQREIKSTSSPSLPTSSHGSLGRSLPSTTSLAI